MKIKKGKKNKMKNGFTLVETLIAISVLLVSITGPLTIASRGLTTASFARDQVTAFYLAQEAAEVVRNKRDTNALSGASWSTGLAECIGQPCMIDATKDIEDVDAIVTCSGACDALKYDSASALYGHSGTWATSKFTRTVSMTQVSTTEMELAITIAWSNGSINKTFTINESLLDWQ